MATTTKNMQVVAGNANASVTAQVTDSMPGVPCPGPAGYKYTGLRYVPVFADPIEWNSANSYEAFTIVMHEGNSYTSKMAVPVGIDINNVSFWVKTFDFNAQLEVVNRQTIENTNNIEANKKELAKKTVVFNSVNDMKNSTSLAVGMTAETLGYYNVNDGGNAFYVITSSKPDTWSEQLLNGLYAQLIPGEYYNIMQLGAQSKVDSSDIINEIMQSNRPFIEIPNGTWVINKPVNINRQGSILICKGILNCISDTPAVVITTSDVYLNIYGIRSMGNGINITPSSVTSEANAIERGRFNISHIWSYRTCIKIDCENGSGFYNNFNNIYMWANYYNYQTQNPNKDGNCVDIDFGTNPNPDTFFNGNNFIGCHFVGGNYGLIIHNATSKTMCYGTYLTNCQFEINNTNDVYLSMCQQTSLINCSMIEDKSKAIYAEKCGYVFIETTGLYASTFSNIKTETFDPSDRIVIKGSVIYGTSGDIYNVFLTITMYGAWDILNTKFISSWPSDNTININNPVTNRLSADITEGKIVTLPKFVGTTYNQCNDVYLLLNPASSSTVTVKTNTGKLILDNVNVGYDGSTLLHIYINANNMWCYTQTKVTNVS